MTADVWVVQISDKKLIRQWSCWFFSILARNSTVTLWVMVSARARGNEKMISCSVGWHLHFVNTPCFFLHASVDPKRLLSDLTVINCRPDVGLFSIPTGIFSAVVHAISYKTFLTSRFKCEKYCLLWTSWIDQSEAEILAHCIDARPFWPYLPVC